MHWDVKRVLQQTSVLEAVFLHVKAFGNIARDTAQGCSWGPPSYIIIRIKKCCATCSPGAAAPRRPAARRRRRLRPSSASASQVGWDGGFVCMLPRLARAGCRWDPRLLPGFVFCVALQWSIFSVGVSVCRVREGLGFLAKDQQTCMHLFKLFGAARGMRGCMGAGPRACVSVCVS